jgi:MFS transporter, DHA1 family, tetracycline resistance protein
MSAPKEQKYTVDYTKILPVLFLEYLSLSLVRSLVPSMIVDSFGGYSYFAVGVMETLKGLLSFVSSPLFGKLSDRIGRKYCLLVTVLGTTLPVLFLAFSNNMVLYSVALSISGFFSATFALTFAYISDCVSSQKRAPAYGLALATFGLSFTIGPIAGSYMAAQFGESFVFAASLVLVVLNVFYILLYLPESAKSVNVRKTYPQKTYMYPHQCIFAHHFCSLIYFLPL